MTAWEELMQRHVEVSSRANVLQDLIRTLDVQYNEDEFLFRGMSDEAASIAAEPATAPNGVYGAGVWVLGATLVPALFVQPGLASRAGSPALLDQVRFVFPEESRELLSGVVAVALDPPVEFASAVSPGGDIRIGMHQATLGIFAEDTLDGERGILTAGHAGEPGSIVRDVDGNRLGSLKKSVSRHSTDQLVPVADVAFISLDHTGVRPAWVKPTIGVAKERETLRVWRKSGPVFTWAQGLLREFIVTPDTPSWGQVTLVGTAVATHGDSGAPVEGIDGAVVGHIVGGTTDGYSVVQDAEYQLNAIGATTG